MSYGWTTVAPCPCCLRSPCVCWPLRLKAGKRRVVPWECPRCGRMNGPQTERCVCKPGDFKP